MARREQFNIRELKVETIKALDDTTGMTFGTTGDGFDFTLWGTTAGSKFFWDESLDKLIMDAADIQLGDSDELRFGDLAAGDWVMKFDSADFSILPASAVEAMIVGGTSNNANVTLKGTLTVGQDDTGYDVIFYSDTALSNMTWTNSSDKLVFDGADVQINDSDELRFGDLAAGDWVFSFNGADFSITPASASEALAIGASGRLANTTLKGTFTVGVDDTGHDVQFFGATSGSYFKWDQTNDKAILVGADVQVSDNDEVRFGTLAAGDIVMKFTGTDMSIVPASAAEGLLLGGGSNLLNTTLRGTLTLGADAAGHDLKLFGGTASAFMEYDASDDSLEFTLGRIEFISGKAGATVLKFADDAGAVCADIATAVGTLNSVVKITVGATAAYLAGYVNYTPA